jgi:AcrR family transcriptional regulator
MSRGDAAEARERLLAAAVALGVTQGAGALTMQGIATAAGVSKALVLYHFGDKAALLGGIVDRLVQRDVERAHAAAGAADPLAAWHALACDADARAERGLLGALALEGALRPAMDAHAAAREAAATVLATAILGALGLRPRISSALLGRLLLRQLDGGVHVRRDATAEAVDAELDGFALAFLALGR